LRLSRLIMGLAQLPAEVLGCCANRFKLLYMIGWHRFGLKINGLQHMPKRTYRIK
jgi:hypothetical protein